MEINHPEGRQNESFLMFLKLKLHRQLFGAQQAHCKRKYLTASATLFIVLSCMNLILASINVETFCLQNTKLLRKSGVNVNFFKCL